MTASEKLRALNGAMTPAGWYDDRHYPEGVYSGKPNDHWDYYLSVGDAEGVVTLRNALPLIADVVEAAEETEGVVGNVIWLDNNIHQYGSDEWRGFFKAALRDAHRAQVALAALTALREHLEGGDE